MTKSIISNFAALLLASLVSLNAATPPRPNFIFILGEGHGWSSTSVQMDDTVPASRSAFVRSPNLEKLAAGGMRFANFYAPSPRCTPSRVKDSVLATAELRVVYTRPEGATSEGASKSK